jgi:hypothetical protein
LGDSQFKPIGLFTARFVQKRLPVGSTEAFTYLIVGAFGFSELFNFDYAAKKDGNKSEY